MEPYARDETVGKILLNIRRRLRARAKRAQDTQDARIAVRAEQALEAYIHGDLRRTLTRLAQIGRIVMPRTDRVSDGPAFDTLCALEARVAHHQAVTPEEALLAVFLVRKLTDR